MNFDKLFAQRRWMPIRNCPGRFGLAEGPVRESPSSIVGDLVSQEFHVPSARDRVIVVRFGDGGLISYRRDDGTYVHTLNTAEGLARKLAQLGIDAL
jgi:phage baseplate assembly protein gpV